MEAAGWQVARMVQGRAAVVCGVGNNAGDGFAAARHLDRWGRLASVCCVDVARIRGPAAAELTALRRGGVEVAEDFLIGGADVVVDAVFGTGLARPPEGRFADWIEAINRSGLRIVSIDVPSGLDAESGVAYAPIVRADLTITLGLPKRGLHGDVAVVDIGIPYEAFAALGVEIPAGAREQIRR